jgi:hypothetical protein
MNPAPFDPQRTLPAVSQWLDSRLRFGAERRAAAAHWAVKVS